jgi:hypothetical protein
VPSSLNLIRKHLLGKQIACVIYIFFNMSAAYTIDHIINEIVDERSKMEIKTGKNPRGHSFYNESWQALNSWIESRLKKRQGASVSPLGEFSWEVKTIDGVASCRPIFLMGESFIKDHHIREKKFYKPQNVASCEEVNYSKLAIKFSKSLTKDMIFSGVRDIIKKMGDYIDRIYEIEIAFTFGVLRSKERRYKFEFDNARLMQILPESMVESLSDRTLGYNQTSGFSTGRTDDMGLSLIGNSASHNFGASLPFDTTNQGGETMGADTLRPVTEGDNATTLPITAKANPATNKPASADFQVPALALNLTYKNVDRSQPPPPLSPGLRELILSMDPKSLTRQAKIERRVQCCDSVAKLAFGRCLYDVESSAVDDDYTHFQSRLLHEQWQEKQRQKQEIQRKEMCDIQETLKGQIEAIQKIKANEVFERKNGSVGTGLPGLSDSRNQVPAEVLKKQKKQMLRLLQKQIVQAKEDIAAKKQATLQEETKQLEVIKNDLDLDRLMSRASALEKQRDLLEAWEREAHIRNLKKLKEQGASAVKKYMQETAVLSKEDLLPSPGSFNMSSARSGVGFDARKRK